MEPQDPNQREKPKLNVISGDKVEEVKQAPQPLTEVDIINMAAKAVSSAMEGYNSRLTALGLAVQFAGTGALDTMCTEEVISVAKKFHTYLKGE